MHRRDSTQWTVWAGGTCFQHCDRCTGAPEGGVSARQAAPGSAGVTTAHGGRSCKQPRMSCFMSFHCSRKLEMFHILFPGWKTLKDLMVAA